MAMHAEIIAIGPFKRHLIEHYEYPSKYYAHTRDDTPIVRTLFGIGEGTNPGTAFALALGISDPWDFNQHKINATTLDFGALQNVLSNLEGWTGYAKDLEALRALASEGYDLYFVLNG